MKTYLILLSAVILFFSSCVPKRKLIAEQRRVHQLQSDSTGTHSKLNNCNSQVASLEQDKAGLQSSLNDLNATYQSTLSNSNEAIANSKEALANSKMTIAEQAKRLRDLQGIIQSERDAMDKLKKTVADALINFKPDELSVTLKDGKLYVSLQEKLLFKSGSAVVDPKGRVALQSLAVVLNSTPGLTINVEGHTDTVPITGRYEDNWALSVARATAIVRILTHDFRVDPHTIIASGRSKYYPVADNKTDEGRAKNRRTEIILSPDLSELFSLLYK